MLKTRHVLNRFAAVGGIFAAGLLISGCNPRYYDADPDSVAKVLAAAKSADWDRCPETLDHWISYDLAADQHSNDRYLYGPKTLPADVIENKISRNIVVSTRFLETIEEHLSACPDEKKAATLYAQAAEKQAAAVKDILIKENIGGKANQK